MKLSTLIFELQSRLSTFGDARVIIRDNDGIDKMIECVYSDLDENDKIINAVVQIIRDN